VRVREGELSRVSISPGDAVVVLLTDSIPWEPRRTGPPLSAQHLRREVIEATRAACEAGRGGLQADLVLGERTTDGPTWLRHGVREARGLARALIELDLFAIRERIHGLVGLGPGLTPSGDDLLCGLIAGLAIFRERGMLWKSGSAEVALGAACEEAAVWRTTSLSRTLLHYARCGVAAEPLLDVLWSLGAARARGGRGVDALLRIGHSSGSDMLSGALLAATAVLEEEAIGTAVVPPAQHVPRFD
jgi:hypothetical protein